MTEIEKLKASIREELRERKYRENAMKDNSVRMVIKTFWIAVILFIVTFFIVPTLMCHFTWGAAAWLMCR